MSHRQHAGPDWPWIVFIALGVFSWLTLTVALILSLVLGTWWVTTATIGVIVVAAVLELRRYWRLRRE